MALYPGQEKDKRVDAETLIGAVAKIFAACGMTDTDARTLSESLVHADLRGIHSHGVLRVPDYVKKFTDDGVDPKARPEIVSERGGAVRIDGRNSMGQIGGRFAMEAVIDRAKANGVAFAALGGSNHCGAMDWYTLMAAEAGMIGLAGTNALPTMAPWGGADKIVGLNPFSIAMPGGREPAVVMDIALGATAHGKIRIHAQKGEPIPEGWAFDTDGRPTTDADAALEGLIQPLGAFKGIGLAMMVGMLSTLLTDAGYGTESGNMIDGAISGADGQFFVAIDISAFTDVDAFTARVDTVVEQFHGSRLAPGYDAVYVPGALENEIAARNRSAGIPLNAETVRGIEESAAALAVPLKL